MLASTGCNNTTLRCVVHERIYSLLLLFIILSGYLSVVWCLVVVHLWFYFFISRLHFSSSSSVKMAPGISSLFCYFPYWIKKAQLQTGKCRKKLAGPKSLGTKYQLVCSYTYKRNLIYAEGSSKTDGVQRRYCSTPPKKNLELWRRRFASTLACNHFHETDNFPISWIIDTQYRRLFSRSQLWTLSSLCINHWQQGEKVKKKERRGKKKNAEMLMDFRGIERWRGRGGEYFNYSPQLPLCTHRGNGSKNHSTWERFRISLLLASYKHIQTVSGKELCGRHSPFPCILDSTHTLTWLLYTKCLILRFCVSSPRPLIFRKKSPLRWEKAKKIHVFLTKVSWDESWNIRCRALNFCFFLQN